MHVYVTHWKRKIVNLTKFVDCSLFYQIFASAFMTMDCSLLWNSHTTWNTYRVYVHQNKMNSTKKSTCQTISNDFYNLICARLTWIVPIKDFAACMVTRIAKSEKFCLCNGARGLTGFDLISFSFPSPPAPSSRVTRGRLGTSQLQSP